MKKLLLISTVCVVQMVASQSGGTGAYVNLSEDSGQKVSIFQVVYDDLTTVYKFLFGGRL